MSLRVAFMGTPEFAVPTLAELAGSGHEIAAVASDDEIVFAMGFDPDPQTMWYARRNIRPVQDAEEAREFLRRRGLHHGVIFRPKDGGLVHERIATTRNE